MSDNFFEGVFVGIFFTAVILSIMFCVSMNERYPVEFKTLNAVCKDKISNTEFREIDSDGNIVCKTLPEMKRLDHTNQYIYIDNIGDD